MGNKQSNEERNINDSRMNIQNDSSFASRVAMRKYESMTVSNDNKWKDFLSEENIKLRREAADDKLKKLLGIN